MTFTRDHHRVIASVLGVLDAPTLRDYHCYFAGGTALALRFGEYRESVDIDFIVSDDASYQELRTACRQPRGFDSLALAGQRVVESAAMRTDRYGIRTRLAVAGVPVKFEIVHEGRIALAEPADDDDEVMGVATANLTDLLATKLLANSDRWADPSVFSRDIIDLAMVAPARKRLIAAVHKAEAVYGRSVRRDAHAAITALLDHDRALYRCQRGLGMVIPTAVMADRLRRLQTSLKRVPEPNSPGHRPG